MSGKTILIADDEAPARAVVTGPAPFGAQIDVEIR